MAKGLSANNFSHASRIVSVKQKPCPPVKIFFFLTRFSKNPNSLNGQKPLSVIKIFADTP